MKKRFLSMLFLIVLIVYSCKTNEELTSVDHNPYKSARTLPTNDENRLLWDWTKSSWTVYYNTNGTVGKQTTPNPFLDPGQLIYGNPDPSKADMYPNQGWMLVARDFGTASGANYLPFIALYNKYRGILRVAIFKTYLIQSTYQQISLSFANSSTIPKLFKFASLKPDYTNYNTALFQSSLTYAGPQQWMIADFNVQGLDNNINNFAAFNINLNEVASSSITTTGTINLDGTAEPVTSNLTIWDGQKAINTFVTSTGDNIAKILDKPDPNKKAIINTLSKLGAAGGLLGVISDAISAFSGGSSSTAYNITLNGTINQTGKITLSTPQSPISIYLKNTTLTDQYKAIQSIPWGVYDAKLIPMTITRDVGDRYTNATWIIPKNSITPNLTINPSIVNDVASINAGLVYKGITPNLIPLSQFESKAYSDTYCTRGCGTVIGAAAGKAPPYGIGLQFIFKDGSVVYQVLSLQNN